METVAPESAPMLYRRHALTVRVAHWVNVFALTILLMSGLNIFDAYPELHWGRSSYSGREAWVTIGAERDVNGKARGVTRVFGHAFDTTGWLGIARGPSGEMEARAFPSWLTIPDSRWLALARSWHFLFAWIFLVNGALYVAYSIGSRHLARDLVPDSRDLRSIGASIIDHLRFRHPTGEAAKRYNVLQKFAYLAMILVVLPLMIATGLGMSPWVNAFAPGWVDVFGGRQSARTIHFICAWLIVAFVVIHVFEVIISGFWNNVRSMITGRYRVPKAHET
ncbi:MAG TPA: cytochrome b/b6 domain-containing protein [Casimicrobiaceae bacterium]|nr:cytochrome b/b6 domain-containing protein [Casimicrobiaceae bacterium]